MYVSTGIGGPQGISTATTLNWMTQLTRPTRKELEQFLTGWSLSGTAQYEIVVLTASTNNSGTSVGWGLGASTSLVPFSVATTYELEEYRNLIRSPAWDTLPERVPR